MEREPTTQVPIETPPAATVEPLPYLRELRDHLEATEPALWAFFASSLARTEHAAELRLELLKSAVRLDVAGHEDLHQAAAEVKERLGIAAQCTLYQAIGTGALNASLHHLPGEAHIVLEGPVLSLLTPAELRCLLAHELAHHVLLERENGAFRIADHLLHSAAAHPAAPASYEHSARHWRLYAEVFADRTALLATGELHAVISSLVKMGTGVARVDAASYLKQAEEIFAGREVKSEGVSHPELYVRARAAALWHDQAADADTRIAGMIERFESLDDLDLLGQRRLTHLTRRFLVQLLRPRWFRTPAALAHARHFFEDFAPADSADDELAAAIAGFPAKTREYFAWMLLDFAAAETSLEDLPLVAAIEWSRELGILEVFEKLAQKELKVKAKEMKRLKTKAREILADAEAAP